MKKILHIISFFLVTISCQKNNPNINTFTNSESVEINSKELTDSLRSYHKKNLNFEGDGVIIIDFRLKGDTLVFYISSRLDKGSIKDNPPGHFSIVDEVPVLFYTGIEKSLTFDSLYISRLYEAIDPYLEEYIEDKDGNVLQVPPNYNPEVWKIEMISNKIIKAEIIN
jgi:hypothetical protein